MSQREIAMNKKGIPIVALLIVSFVLPALPGYGQDQGDEVYVIKRGDTLWDLSGSYLKDPYQWPELWQRNQYITNPHLIYPGNSLRLHGRPMPVQPTTAKEGERVEAAVTEPAVAEVAPVSEAAETTTIEEGMEESAVMREKPEGMEESAVTARKEEVAPPEKVEPVPVTEGEEVVQVLRKGGVEYVILEEESMGRIIDARYQKKLLAQGDTVYVALKKGYPEVGERFLVFRTQKMLRNPYTKKKGKKIYLLGALEVTAVKGVLYQAEITDSLDAIRRGDEIMTYRTLQ